MMYLNCFFVNKGYIFMSITWFHLFVCFSKTVWKQYFFFYLVCEKKQKIYKQHIINPINIKKTKRGRR